LIVAGPKIPLLPQEVESIRTFLHGGGNALFMIEPHIETGLEPVLAEFEMKLEDDMIVDEASHFWSDVTSPAVTRYYRHAVTNEVPLTFFPGVRSILPLPKSDSSVTTEPLVDSSPASYGETDPRRAHFDSDVDLKGPLTIMVLGIKRYGGEPFKLTGVNGSDSNAGPPAEPNQALPPGPAAAAPAAGAGQDASKREYSSRVIVVGDVDFATNSFFHYMGNGVLFLNAVNYLASRENLIGIEPPTYDLPRVNLTNRQMKGTFFLAIVLIPAIAGLVGIGVWWKQR
jgi:ABC-type uncharacterized transport system involved in gliding motility auxiliary subunit